MKNKYVGAMQKFIPAATKGDWAVDHFAMTKKEVEFAKLRGMMHPGGYSEVYDLEAGNYTHLLLKSTDCVMSDTPMELRTQALPVRFASGEGLVAGLGLGIFILQIQDKTEVTGITVIEKEQDVIDLVAPHLPLSPKVTIIKGDIFDKEAVSRALRFDFIYFDIWNDICGDNAYEVGKLKRAWRPLLRKENPTAWIGAWREDDFAYRRRQVGNRF